MKKIIALSVCLIAVALIDFPSTLAQLHQYDPNRGAGPTTDWQTEEQMAIQSEREGDFKAAERNFLRAKKDLLRESKSSPPSSFSNRWFPLQNALRSLYLDRATAKENSLPFAKVDELYKKALQIPGTSFQMWEQYADFLRRKGKAKQAQKVEKEGRKKSLYSTEPQ